MVQRIEAGWNTTALGPYLGRACTVTMACGACGREHVRQGQLMMAHRPGTFMLGGMIYDLQEIVAIVPEEVERLVQLDMHRLVTSLVLLAGCLSWLRFAHR